MMMSIYICISSMATTAQNSDLFDLSLASSSGSEFYSSAEIIPNEQIPMTDSRYHGSFSDSPNFNEFHPLPSPSETPCHQQVTQRRDSAEMFQNYREDNFVPVTTDVSGEIPPPNGVPNFSSLHALTGFSVENVLSDRKTSKRSRSEDETQEPSSKRSLTADCGDINSFMQDFGQQIPQKSHQSPEGILSDVIGPASTCFDVYQASILANSDYYEDGLQSDQESSSTAPSYEQNFTLFPSTNTTACENYLPIDESRTFDGLYLQRTAGETANFYENDHITVKAISQGYDDVTYSLNTTSDIDGYRHRIDDIGISRQISDLEPQQTQYSDIYEQTRILEDHKITNQTGVDTSHFPVDNFFHNVQSYPTYETQPSYFIAAQQDENLHSFVPVNHSDEFELQSRNQISRNYLLQEMCRQQTVPNADCEQTNEQSLHVVTPQPIGDLSDLSKVSQEGVRGEGFGEERETFCRSNENSEVIVISSNPATPEKQQNSYCHASSRVILKQNVEISDARYISLKDYASSVTLQLLGHELWHKFHKIGTEMIITKAGRRMFPSLKVSISGLMPQKRYIMVVDILPLDNKRYRYLYSSSQWMAAGNITSPVPKRAYVHPESPALGETWMRQTIVFDKMKLTNNEANNKGHIILHSMHKYQPRIHLIECEGNGVRECETITLTQYVDTSRENVLTFIFPETQFTTVTAYQNQQITKLKIDKNPFAKGFRDTARNCRPQEPERDTSDDKMRHYYRTAAPVMTVSIEQDTTQHRFIVNSNNSMIVQGNSKQIDIIDGEQISNQQDDGRTIQWSG